MCNCAFFVPKKRDLEIHTFFARLPFASVLSHFFALWKCAIAHMLFQKDRTCKKCVKNGEIQNRTFLHFKKSNNWKCAIAHFLCKKLQFANCTFFARLPLANVQMCDHTFFALTVENVRLCNCTFFHSLQILKWANMLKMCEFPNRTFFAQKKASAHFQNVQMPNPENCTMKLV